MSGQLEGIESGSRDIPVWRFTMKRYPAIVVALCAFGALLAAQAARPATESSVVQVDRTLGAAFDKGDRATENKLLDAEFTWIDTDGIMYERPDALRAALKPLVPNSSDVKTIEHKYGNGKVVWIQ